MLVSFQTLLTLDNDNLIDTNRITLIMCVCLIADRSELRATRPLRFCFHIKDINERLKLTKNEEICHL